MTGGDEMTIRDSRTRMEGQANEVNANRPKGRRKIIENEEEIMAAIWEYKEKNPSKQRFVANDWRKWSRC